MFFLQNDKLELTFNQTDPSFHTALIEDLGQDSLLELDVAFEIFTETNDRIIQKGLTLDDESMTKQSSYELDLYGKDIERLQVKSRVNSHMFAIVLFHSIEKILMARLHELDNQFICDKMNEKIKADEEGRKCNHNGRVSLSQCIQRLEYKGLCVTKIKGYQSFNKLRYVSNLTKHRCELDEDESKLHYSFKKQYDVPDLGDFLFDNRTYYECGSFVWGLYEAYMILETDHHKLT